LKTNCQQSESKGFTLLEVLIAMAIFGYAAVSLVAGISKYQRTQMTSSQRTIAHWVAMNRLAETRLEKKWPNVGVTRGSDKMANVNWYWLQTVTKTTEKNLRQVVVEVRLLEDDELFTSKFTGFIANKTIAKK
jgi:general secretion pathway protein I